MSIRDCQGSEPNFLRCRINWTIDYLDKKSGYGLPLQQLDRYWEQMNLLELETRVWPTPNHVNKLGSPRPKTVVLMKGGPIPANTVLKRTHSDGELHVQIPGQHERTWNQLDDGPDGALWFSQEYVALLREVGEWRVVMAGVKIVYIVHTASNGGSWSFLDMNRHLSLRELRKMLELGKLNQITVLDTNTDIPIMEREIGHHLVGCEWKKMGGMSTLEVFCRIDVGLMLKEDGELGYFMNKVEQTLTAGLWTTRLDVDYNVFATTFAQALLRWANALP
ncbi:hypothetical protein BYT27DRAFT_7213050 [Phlegmacium glaucopus]|nr:hypothetical protein BYT27DRAFT_7213050 [Phlegmacium glaucopus]